MQTMPCSTLVMQKSIGLTQPNVMHRALQTQEADTRIHLSTQLVSLCATAPALSRSMSPSAQTQTVLLF